MLWLCPRDGFILSIIDVKPTAEGHILIFKCLNCGGPVILDAGKQMRHGSLQTKKFIRSKIAEFTEAKKDGRNDDRRRE